MKTRRYSAMSLCHLLAACLAVGGAALTVSCGTLRIAQLAETEHKWSLWTQGTRLRGANIYQRRVYPELDGTNVLGPGPVGPPFTASDFEHLASLGANCVVISHPGLFTETPPYEPDPGVQANLDSLLEAIAQADLCAVIAFRTGPGRSEFSLVRGGAGDWFPTNMINDAIWTNDAAQAAWAHMWRYTADRYRGSSAIVGYELMVEPNACDVVSNAPAWPPWKFHRQYGGTSYDWNRLYPRVLRAVRDVDPETPVLVGSDGYSGVVWLPYVKPCGDARTVYTVHQYEPGPYTHQQPDESGRCSYPGFLDPDWGGRRTRFSTDWIEDLYSVVRRFGAKADAPVAVTELGVCRWAPGASAFLSDQLNVIEEQGMNWALWLWECSYTNYTRGVHTFNFRLGAEPVNRDDVLTNSLMQVIRNFWIRNARDSAH